MLKSNRRTPSDVKTILLGCSEYTVNTIFMLSYGKGFWHLLPENAISDIVSSMWSTYRNVHILHLFWCIYSHNLHIDTCTIHNAQKVYVNIPYFFICRGGSFYSGHVIYTVSLEQLHNGWFCKGCITRRVNRTLEICHIIILLHHGPLIKD